MRELKVWYPGVPEEGSYNAKRVANYLHMLFPKLSEVTYELMAPGQMEWDEVNEVLGRMQPLS